MSDNSRKSNIQEGEISSDEAKNELDNKGDGKNQRIPSGDSLSSVSTNASPKIRKKLTAKDKISEESRRLSFPRYFSASFIEIEDQTTLDNSESSKENNGISSKNKESLDRRKSRSSFYPSKVNSISRESFGKL